MLSGEGYHVPIELDAPQLHTRVSVGQLRSALLQQTGNGAQPEKVYDHLHVCDPDRHYQPVYLCDNICLRLINFFPFLLLLFVCLDTSCPATSSLDLAVKPGSEGGRRRTRRYLPGGSGGGRKTSERFRTQPITANEMEESSG